MLRFSRWPVLLTGLALIVVALALSANLVPQAAADSGSTDEVTLQLTNDEILVYMSQPGWVGDVQGVKSLIRESKTEQQSAANCSERPNETYIALAVGPGPLLSGRKSVMTVRAYRNPDPSLEHKWGPGFGAGLYAIRTQCMQADYLASARAVIDENMSGQFTATYGLYVYQTNNVVVGPVSYTYNYPFVPAATSTPSAYPAPVRVTPTPSPTQAAPEAYPAPSLPGFVGDRPTVQLTNGFICRSAVDQNIPAYARPAGTQNKRLQCAFTGGQTAYVLPD